MSNTAGEIARELGYKLERLRITHKFTSDQLQKSLDLIAHSLELLRLPLPTAWHPEPKGVAAPICSKCNGAMVWLCSVLDATGGAISNMFTCLGCNSVIETHTTAEPPTLE